MVQLLSQILGQFNTIQGLEQKISLSQLSTHLSHASSLFSQSSSLLSLREVNLQFKTSEIVIKHRIHYNLTKDLSPSEKKDIILVLVISQIHTFVSREYSFYHKLLDSSIRPMDWSKRCLCHM